MGASLEDNASKKGKMSGSHQSSIEPLHIKVEDEDYMPDNESGATPDSSQTSPHGRNRKLKGTCKTLLLLCQIFVVTFKFIQEIYGNEEILNRQEYHFD